MDNLELRRLAKQSAMDAIDMLDLEKIIRNTCKAAVYEALDRAGAAKDIISQRESFRLYGEGLIRFLVREERIKRRKTGENTSKILYSRKEIELAKAILEAQ